MLDVRRIIACAAILAALFVGCAKRPALTGATAPAPTGAAAVQSATGGEVEIGRASCRKECQSVCRSRWSPYH